MNDRVYRVRARRNETGGVNFSYGAGKGKLEAIAVKSDNQFLLTLPDGTENVGKYAEVKRDFAAYAIANYKPSTAAAQGQLTPEELQAKFASARARQRALNVLVNRYAERLTALGIAPDSVPDTAEELATDNQSGDACSVAA